MVAWRKAVGPVAAILIVAALIGLVWSRGWWGGGDGGTNGPPAVSPVTATFSCVRTAPGAHWRATLVSASGAEPLQRYEVTLYEVPTDAKIVDEEKVRDGYVAGTDDVSLWGEDNDRDAKLTAGDAFVVGSVGPGPYDLALIWAENGATATAVRCA